MCPLYIYIYTKTFGGKIWQTLHSVSPDINIYNQTKRAYFEIFPAKKNAQHLAQKLDALSSLPIFQVKC